MPTKQLDVFAHPEPFFRFNRKTAHLLYIIEDYDPKEKKHAH